MTFVQIRTCRWCAKDLESSTNDPALHQAYKMNSLTLLPLISLFTAIITGLLGLKSIRSRSYPQAEISLKQGPLSPWRYETVNMIALGTHSLGLISIALV